MTSRSARLFGQFSPYRLGVQAALLATLLVLVTAVVLGTQTLNRSIAAIIDHEKVDLRDETNLVARDLLDDYTRLRAEAATASARIAAGLATPDQVVRELEARPEIGAVQFVPGKEALRGRTEYDPPELVAGGAGDADPGAVWYGRVLMSVRGITPGAPTGLLSLSGRLDALTSKDRSPRHLTFVFAPARGAGNDADVLRRPHPHGRTRPVPVEVRTKLDALRGKFARWTDEFASGTPTAAEPGWRDRANEAYRDARVGEPVLDPVRLGGYEFYFAATDPIVGPNGLPIDFEGLRESLRSLERRFPEGIISPQRGATPRVYLRAWDEPTLDEMRAAVEQQLPGADIHWSARAVHCNDFLLTATRAYYDLSQPADGYVDLAVAASPDEMKSYVSSRFWAVKLMALALAAAAVPLSLLAAKWITLPLERIVDSTGRLARGEAALDLPTDRRGEIGVLARRFREMADVIADRNRALADREARMRAIVGSAAEGILTVDRHGVVQTVNAAGERIFGLTLAPAAGRPFADLIDPPAGLDATTGPDATTAVAGAPPDPLPPPGTYETTARHADGRRFPVEMSLSEVARTGYDPEGSESSAGWTGPVLYTAIVRDITARKRAESEIRGLNADLNRLNAELDNRVRRRTVELERLIADLEVTRDEAVRANEAKSAFLANMSHELRTPLGAIIGYAELLIEEAEDLGQASFTPDLRKIIDAGRHLLTLINDLLDLSKIDAGKMQLHEEAIDVDALIDGVTETIRPLAVNRGNRLAVEKRPAVSADGRADGTLGVMRGDLTRVRQVLLNLLSNACKFTEAGTVTLTVARRPAEPGEGPQPGVDGFAVEVRDSGIGITPEQMKRLFQNFSQADSSTTKKYGGTGLGLSISKRLCELMGGSIAADSTPGVGSAFRIWLPAVPPVVAPAPAVADAPAPDAGRDLPRDAPTVLVIDDDPAVRDLMTRQLGREGLRVILASCGADGIAAARTQQPAFITLDVMMPGTDGWAVLSDLKTDPATRDIPVIMLTMVDDRDLGFALGAAEFLTKPVDRERLLDLVARHRPDPSRPILVAEDDPAAREVLRRNLTGAGYAVLEACDGRQALELLDRCSPSVILLDLMMPVMDGFQFLDALRARPDHQTVPVIVVTAKDVTPADRDRLNGRVLRILQKGNFRRDDLMREVRRLAAQAGRDANLGPTVTPGREGGDESVFDASSRIESVPALSPGTDGS